MLLAPVAALADGGNGNGNGNVLSDSQGWQQQYGGAVDNGIANSTFVQDSLWQQAKQHGNDMVHLIIQSTSVGGAQKAFSAASDQSDGDRVSKHLSLIGAIAVDIRAKRLQKLAQNPVLVITPDAPVKTSGSDQGLSSTQLWPYETGNAALWDDNGNSNGAAPTIAVVDSGLDGSALDFGGRAFPQVNLSSLSPGATGDDRGHGTFVAGIAAGSATGVSGAAPGARILPIRVMDRNGAARTSDVINALQWIGVNKTPYNVGVVNLSLHSSTATHFYFDPLDRAAEQLWFDGIVVVAAAGNYGKPTGPSGVGYSPGNDPFVITVGAADIGTSPSVADDTRAPWSAYGYTEDGFAKPEIGAPGRYMIGPVPLSSTLVSERPDHVVSPGYMRLSGTSFAAPVVSGTAAEILQQHPSWTPDQVKGVLMLTARPIPNAPGGALGVGMLTAKKAVNYNRTPPNPNSALERFVKLDPVAGGVTFDFASWANVAHANASWAAASWADASWADASWSAASWADIAWSAASWAAASWADASWVDASWTDASWAAASWADGVEGEAGSTPLLDPAAAAAVQADPALAIPADAIATLPVAPAAPGSAAAPVAPAPVAPAPLP